VATRTGACAGVSTGARARTCAGDGPHGAQPAHGDQHSHVLRYNHPQNDRPGVRTEPQPNVHPTKPAVKAGGLCCVRTRRAAATFAALLRLESEGTVPPPGLVCRTRDALAVNVGCNVAQLLGVMVAVVQMDSLGRRYLALRSLGGVVISLLALVAAFAVPSLRYAAVPALLLYLVAFGSGLSAVPWVVNAEIYPMHLRAVATGTF
jgi:hypothetical protein